MQEQAYTQAPLLYFRPATVDDLARITALEVGDLVGDLEDDVVAWLPPHVIANTPLLSSIKHTQTAGYPPDEAATEEKLRFRITNGVCGYVWTVWQTNSPVMSLFSIVTITCTHTTPTQHPTCFLLPACQTPL